MIEITSRLEERAPNVQAHTRLELPFELRQKSRLRTHLARGEDVWLVLARGEILRGGDLLAANDGRLVRVDGTGDSEAVGARVREALAL